MTTLVSVNRAGTGGKLFSRLLLRMGTNTGDRDSGITRASITEDGSFVAFSIDASDLVATDTNGTR